MDWSLPLPGVLQPWAAGPGIDTFRLLALLGALAAGAVYVRLWRRVDPDASPGAHLWWAALGAYAGGRLAVLVEARTLPGSFWSWLGFDELTLSWAGAGLGALAGAALAARLDGLDARTALDAAATALGVGFMVGAWGSGRVGTATSLPWAVPPPGAAGLEVGVHPVAIYLSLVGAAAAAAAWSRFRAAPGSGGALAAALLVLGLGRYAAGLMVERGGPAGALLGPAALGDLAWIAAGMALMVPARRRPGPVVGTLVLALAVLTGVLAWQAALAVPQAPGTAAAVGPGFEVVDLSWAAGAGAGAEGAPAAPVVGFRAPDFEAHTVDGRVFRLSDLRGRPVLLNFWATWCEPCRIEMPEIQRFHQRYGDRVAVVGINVREPRDLVQTYVEANGFTWTFVLDPGSRVADLYRLRPIPTSFFVDGSGVIRHIEYGILTEAAIRAVFDRLLRQQDAG
ncbi:MAG: TlpA disulfide reductase family protein [Thermaerobacter sp.]